MMGLKCNNEIANAFCMLFSSFLEEYSSQKETRNHPPILTERTGVNIKTKSKFGFGDSIY